MMYFDEWVKKYLGKATDYDGVAGAQCVDTVKTYLKSVFEISAGAWGNAKDYWTNFENVPQLKNNFTKVKNNAKFVPQKGDIVVWSGEVSSSNNYGHIAVATGEGTTSYFYSYDQNWASEKMTKIYHNYFAVYGVLRPKDQSKIEKVNPPKIKAPTIKNGTYKLTNVRGIYKGYGSKTGRKKVKEITLNARLFATSKKSKNEAFLRANTSVTISETKLLSTGNLWAKIPSGYICVWEKDQNKKFIK